MSRPIRVLMLVVSLGVMASAALGAGLAVLLPAFVEGQRVALGLFGFELVTLVAAVLGVLAARGRFDQSPAMALACIGGTILVSSALGWQAAGRQLGGVSLLPFLGLRSLAALAILAAAAVCILKRDPGSWKPAMVGAVLGIPAPVAAAAMVYPRTRLMIESTLADYPTLFTVMIIAGVIVLGGMLAASVHLIIGAFDRAADAGLARQDSGIASQ